MTRALRYMWVVGGAAMSILLFLLASASSNTDFFGQNYSRLLLLNGMVAIGLLLLVIVMLSRLYRRYKRGRFGSRLMTRLVLLFAIMGILPGTVIYVVSVQFVSRSIESWFDVQVEAALESGISLGRNVLDAALADLNKRAQGLAQELSGLTPSERAQRLARLEVEPQTFEATIVDAGGRPVVTSSGELTRLVPEMPTPEMLQQARLTRHFAALEGDLDLPETPETEVDGMRMRVVVPIGGIRAGSPRSDALYLQLLQTVPSGLTANAEALRTAYSEYQARSLARSGLRKIYVVTLSLTLLLAIAAAIAAAFQISSNLAKPLLLLAEGTKAVAEGDLSPRPIVSSSDELGTLTQSFNIMTRQLSDARTGAEKARAELENAKIYLESVLANMSAGVIVLDREFRLVSCNDPVESILRQDLRPHIGRELAAVDGMAPFAAAIAKAFSEQSARSAASPGKPGTQTWQQQIELPGEDPDNVQDTILLARGSRLPVKEGTGYIVVFDDITEVISAQRSIAWGEVARRLAHEIKNPLTPIQLSAERLQMKLHDKLDQPDVAMLEKSTRTIVNQVDSMKRMVDNFREYAKAPPAVLEPLDLNALIEEIVHLYTGSDSRATIHTQLAPGLPRIMGDATQLRQVIHNLLQNAQDAVAEKSGEGFVPSIDVLTEEVRYQDAAGQERIAVRLSVMDNGPGFSPKILGRVFEPYVTTKSRGTGLGMAMVKKIVDEHGGRIDLRNRTDASGAKVSVLLLKLAATDE